MKGPRGLVLAGLVSLALVIFINQLFAQGNVPPEVQQAQAMIQAKDYDGAIKILEDFTQKNPNRMGALNILGTAYQQKGELEKALVAFEKVAQFPPLKPQAQHHIAVIYVKKSDKEAALKYLQKLKETGSFDMDLVINDPEMQILKNDQRFAMLIPKPEDFANPFVEKVKIIREFDGEQKGGQFGWIARRVGDVDRDGVFDFVTSAPTFLVNGKTAGKVYVYSSKTGKLLWSQTGQPNDYLGLGIEGAGDTNHDGIPDVVASAPGAQKAYIYSGKDGTLLHTFEAKDKTEAYGRHVSTAGDVNGDKYDDVVIGSPGNGSPGQGPGHAYIYSGKDGALLQTLEGEKAGDGFGNAVAGYKHGGHSLVIVGAPAAGPRHTGRAYVYEDMSTKPKFVFDSDETGGAFGAMFLSVPGDVNGDKVPDIYVSDWSNNAKGQSTGRIYVYSGVDGNLLLTLTGETSPDGFGIGVADAGDVNHDGYADLIVGAWQHSSAAASGGKSYLYSGRDGKLLQTYTCRIPGDTFGFDATEIGDVDGDGDIDFLITSAYSQINGFQSGRVFIISSKVAK